MQKINNVPDELKHLLPEYDIILVFGRDFIKFPELSISQSLIFFKYLYNFISIYNKEIEEERNKDPDMNVFELLSNVGTKLGLEEYFKNMFKEMFPGLTDEILNTMTKKQFIYNLNELYKVNFTKKKEEEKMMEEIKEIIPILKL